MIRDRIDGGLIREDGDYMYIVRQQIPVMLIDEALPLTVPPEAGVQSGPQTP